MKTTNESKAEVMRRRIEFQSTSGLTVTEYCAQNGIVKSNYYYWHRKLSERRDVGFTPIHVGRDSSIEITYPNGVQLSFTGEIDTTIIKALVCCI